MRRYRDLFHRANLAVAESTDAQPSTDSAENGKDLTKPATLPTFEERTPDGILQHGGVIFSAASGAKIWTGVVPELNEIDVASTESLQRKLNDGTRLPLGAAAACLWGGTWGVFPQSWTLLLLPELAIEKRAISAADIGPTNDLFERFRRVHRWAKAHGYPGGFPTFVDEQTPAGETYGVVLIKPGMGEEVWVPVK